MSGLVKLLIILAAALVIGILFFTGFGTGKGSSPGQGSGGSGTTTLRLSTTP